jgi:protein-L-isoaspartate O-methyltransferase
MWADADLAEGQDVLEIGTGTGYSTALFSQRYGSARLTSIDIDPARLDQAAQGLARCGFGPRLAIADGLYGYWPYAPYDRIVAACSVRRIPHAWLAQTKPGGKILTTIGGWLHGYARALLKVDAEGHAHGALLPGTISFMMARTDEPPRPGNVFHWEPLVADTEERPARHSPERLTEPSEEAFHGRFLAQLAVPGTQLSIQGDHTYLVDVTTGSAALVRKGTDGWTVRQTGPARLCGQIEAAWDLWDSAGRPGPQQFTIEVNGDQQRIEQPTAGLSFLLP